jgi:hypothetical protein
MTGKEIDDGDYFARRAREERQRAALCEDNAAALVHLKMADEYDKLLGSPARSEQALAGG